MPFAKNRLVDKHQPRASEVIEAMNQSELSDYSGNAKNFDMDFSDVGSPWQDKEILRKLYVELEMSTTEIADCLDCTSPTVLRWLDKHGIDTRDVGSESDPNALYNNAKLLREMYVVKELPVLDIAEYCGCHEATIQNALDRHDIERRPPGQYVSKDAPWRNEKRLRKAYLDQKKSMKEIGDEWNVSPKTVNNALDRFEIETRTKWGARLFEPATYRTSPHGYEYWRSICKSEKSSVGVHQLLVIANGANPYNVFGGSHHTHHKNGIPWDNRSTNVELLTASEHARTHSTYRERSDRGQFK